jgi:hypothetical protein
MRREQIAMIWIGGFVLAVALYVVGPDRFIGACWDLIDKIDEGFRALVAQLGERTYGVVRAFALAIYVVFAVLCVLSSRRGHQGFWPLLVVTAVFGAVVMTQRVTAQPPNRGGSLPPYPPGRAP